MGIDLKLSGLEESVFIVWVISLAQMIPIWKERHYGDFSHESFGDLLWQMNTGLPTIQALLL